MKKYLAEFIGTFALVLVGTGAICVNEVSDGSVGLIGIALAFGLIIVAMIYTLGPRSGCHINPAVTLALAIDKQLPSKEIPGYLMAQCAGALAASLALSVFFPSVEMLGATLPAGSWEQSFFLEIVTTFLLMLVILGITQNKQAAHLAGVVIGLTVTGLIPFAGPISGGSFNPARSLGPAVVSGHTTHLWIYLIAPIVGAILAVYVWKFVGTKSN